MREELQRFPLNDPKSLEIVREFLSELTQEIIQEGF
jgi:hypothetical protein